jgi:hypothetical protein
MATGTLTTRESRQRQTFIDAAYERDPAAGRAAAVREGTATWREWRGGFGSTRQAPARAAAAETALAEAVAAAVRGAVATRRALRKARKRQAREAAAASRLVLESRAVSRPGTISEAVLDSAPHLLTNEQLAELALAAPGRSPFAEASPGGAIVRASADRGAAATGAAVSEAAQARDFARLSADGLHEQLAGRLGILGEAGGFRSPAWAGRA